MGFNEWGQDSQQQFGLGRFKNINTKESSRTSIQKNYKMTFANSHVIIRYELLWHREGDCVGFNIWGRILTNSLEPWEYFMKLMIKDIFQNIMKD